MILLFTASPAFAASKDCFGFDEVSSKTNLALGKISTNEKRATFLKNEAEKASCPSASKQCRAKTYLIPGDEVILSGPAGDFVCATYINRKGLAMAGWLPASMVQRQAAPSYNGLEDWMGVWHGDVEHRITIKAAARKGYLSVEGEATYGAQDPARVKRGGVNMGEISGETAPAGDSLAFTMGENATLPYDKGDQFSCRVQMRLLGPYLLVKDNRNCGGHNVSFSEAYRRVKK